jgi:DNA-binding NarL/FixJ family response regulator
MNDQTQKNRIRLVLVDDHGLLRASLGRLLASESDLEFTEECSTFAEAVEVLRRSTVDVVVLLDLGLGTEQGKDFVSAARQAGYQGKFLIVVASPDVEKSAIALKLGVSGIVLRSNGPERLLQAIRLVKGGGTWVDIK